MKNLLLLFLVLGSAAFVQAQENWKDQSKIFDQVYSLATELNKQTDKVVAQSNVISINTGGGTVSVEKKLDKSKPSEYKHFYYNLLTSSGKEIRLDKMNAERVIESFQSKLLQLKEKLRNNQDADVENVLKDLFK